MSIVEIFERLQDTSLSRTIGESTWGYPIVGALHVLAIALFAGWMLAAGWRDNDSPQIAKEVRLWKAAGIAIVCLTGILLFMAQAVHYSQSTAFRIKLGLLALILLNAVLPGSVKRRWISFALWAAVIVAARGIAFY